eukprot:3868-Heterococcus_DN1.PRE.7
MMRVTGYPVADACCNHCFTCSANALQRESIAAVSFQALKCYARMYMQAERVPGERLLVAVRA